MYEIVKNYRDNDELRKSFNNLAVKTFGFDFEDWYQNGYWGDKYNPYSVLCNGEIIANVSVNTMEFVMDGKELHYIQLGTVMTEESYRNKGLIRMLMEEIDKDYKGKNQGFYLFGGDNVIDFYPKFGYKKAKEFQYVRNVENEKEATAKSVPMNCKEEWDKLTKIINEGDCNCRFKVDNEELVMFYVTKFMQECVYYVESQNAYVIAEIDEGELVIHNVFAEGEVNLVNIVDAFGKDVKKAVLGFTPNNPKGFEKEELKVEDCTLFVKEIEGYEENEVMFPSLSHA